MRKARCAPWALPPKGVRCVVCRFRQWQQSRGFTEIVRRGEINAGRFVDFGKSRLKLFRCILTGEQSVCSFRIDPFDGQSQQYAGVQKAAVYVACSNDRAVFLLHQRQHGLNAAGGPGTGVDCASGEKEGCCNLFAFSDDTGCL